MKKGNKIKLLWEVIVIAVMSVLGAAVVHYFQLPTGLSIGSVPGLAVVLGHFVPMSVSTITMVLNVILLVGGTILIGKGFGVKTVSAVIIFTTSLSALEVLAPNPMSMTQDPLLDMLAYVFLMSACQAILFECGASLGGLDIVAKIMSKFLRIEVGKAVSMAGLVVACSAVLTSDAKTVIISVLGTYMNGIVVDHFIFGMNPKKRVCIISKKEPEVTDYILNVMKSGASLCETIGAYTGDVHREIITIVNKSEYRQLMGYLEKVDPDAFVTIYTVHGVHYRPKPTRE